MQYVSVRSSEPAAPGGPQAVTTCAFAFAGPVAVQYFPYLPHLHLSWSDSRVSQMLFG